MLYRFLKYLVRPCLKLFCREIYVNRPDMAHLKGPVLIASNHPNSFLDAILLDIFFDQPVYSLARGDAFINRWVRALFRKLHILPVYRTSEGTHNLEKNYQTFDSCKDIFRQNGMVLIFSEGLCINEWRLRPLKKGTARLALQCWENGIPLRVLPVGINYSSFYRIGKNVFINLGELITSDAIDFSQSEGQKLNVFTDRLEKALQPLVYDIPLKDRSEQKKVLVRKLSVAKQVLLLPPALIGLITHLPLYLPVHGIVYFRYRHTGHKDSVAIVCLLLLYPFYLYLLAKEANQLLYSSLLTWIGVCLLLPLTARAYILVKPQLDRNWWT